jgi:ferric-dicitrate binding protein FerR (iron transport regulator)
MASETATKTGMYAQRLLDNEYVQENLAQAVESLRAAYRRASKRRVEPTRDEKLRRQVREAALSLTEAASALKAGRQKPRRRRGRKMIVMLAIGAGAAAALLAARRKVLSDDSETNRDPQTPAAADSEVPAVA